MLDALQGQGKHFFAQFIYIYIHKTNFKNLKK